MKKNIFLLININLIKMTEFNYLIYHLKSFNKLTIPFSSKKNK